MRIAVRKGYTVYRTQGDYTYVCPHSGPALELPISRDDNSETIASLCWMRTGGNFILSNLSRKRAYGVDFNRKVPPHREALSMWDSFIKDENQKKMHEYRKNYAWVAKDYKDHDRRKKIYHSFWNEVREGKFIILMHTAFSRLKIMPSVIDITTFEGRGIDKKVLEGIVEEVNEKNKAFFKDIEKECKAYTLLEEERTINNTIRVYNTFGLQRASYDFLDNIKRDLDVIKKNVEPDVIENLKSDFTPRNFLRASKKALMKIEPPRITVEHFFKGMKSWGPRDNLFPLEGRTVMNFECTRFINFWYPHKAAEMITDIIEKVKESRGLE
jgi:hypothetical protein